MPAPQSTVDLLRDILEAYARTTIPAPVGSSARTRGVLILAAQLADLDDAAAMEFYFANGERFEITLRAKRTPED